MSGLLAGRCGLVVGVATERSYAWHIARALQAQGARLGFAVLPGERAVARATAAIGALGLPPALIQPCDVRADADLDALFAAWDAACPRLDFVVHSIAYADRDWLAPGRFTATPRAAFHDALDVSSYSLVALAQRARPRLAVQGGAIVAMSYLGGERVLPGYNVMGVAKAALECAMRYLAAELGPEGIRVSCVSGGAFRTTAAMGVGGFRTLFEHGVAAAPLRRGVTGDDVGGAVAFLVSDLGAGITGEVVHVDCGLHALGPVPAEAQTGV